HLQGGGLGAPLSQEGTTWITDVPPLEEVDMYYTNELQQNVLLGRYKVSSGEKKDVGLLRLAEEVLLPATLSFSIISVDGTPVEGLSVSALYGSGEVAASVTSDEAGFCSLFPLAQHRLIRLLAVKGKDEQQVLVSDLVLKQEAVIGQVYTWMPKRPRLVKVGDQNGKPVSGARVTLSASTITGEDVLSDGAGEALFAEIVSGAKYTLSVYHPFFHLYEKKDFTPDLAGGEESITLSSRPGLKVLLNGPAWEEEEEGLFVRSWIATAQDNMIFPDYRQGNEYAEVLKQPELLFLAPPDRPFFIYVGGMVEPWGAQLFGPFSPGQELIELELVRTAPLEVVVEKDSGQPVSWDLGLFAIRGEGGQKGQLVAYQALKSTEDRKAFFLGPGTYEVTIQAAGYKMREKVFDVGDSGGSVSVHLEAVSHETPSGGYVKNFIMSDKFMLVTSDEEFHHGQMCYGFNKDWLAHLGGEASFVARHLQENPAIEGGGVVTWREVPSGGVLDFKSFFIANAVDPKNPSGSSVGDYAVAYAQFRVESPEERQLILGVGSDDGVKGWVNSTRVVYNHQPHPLYAQDQNLVPITLKQGWNQINFKVDQSWGQWQLRVRFIDPDTKQPVTDMRLDPDGGYSSVASP
ncbi:MAG: carboxypeptidase regulatory-like domain-containing protein, partial [Planctomycetes bacterium]|nr:carboxypeptidase regulatory-like domain-containing protein [Planctomycetota bacterium]